MYLIFKDVNGYFEEINKTKYLMLVSTTWNKEKIKKYEELWEKMTDLIRPMTKTTDDYDERWKSKLKWKSNLI